MLGLGLLFCTTAELGDAAPVFIMFGFGDVMLEFGEPMLGMFEGGDAMLGEPFLDMFDGMLGTFDVGELDMSFEDIEFGMLGRCMFVAML